MNYKNTLIGSLAVLVLAGCGNSSSNETTDATDVNPPAITTASLTDTVPATVTPGNSIPANTTTTTLTPGNNVQTPAITPGTKLNPAHGQPGHRCEIAVGAPLDSKPGPGVTVDPFATTQPKNNQPVTVSSMPASPTVTTAAGMNPAHGQPGHRCDIAVGAPLDSKPTTTTQSLPLLPSEEIKPSPIVTPTAPAQTPITKTVTAPGMNPPHGEPGHRCDISVGAPLNSAPAPVKKN